MNEIPRATLEAVYKREQPARRNWPVSFEEGMRDPIISRIVEMLARHQIPAYKRTQAPRYSQRRGLSGKDLAAGERDD